MPSTVNIFLCTVVSLNWKAMLLKCTMLINILLQTCADRCEEFKDCVQCQMFKNGPLKGADCLSNCTKFTPDSVDYIESEYKIFEK